MNAQPNIPDEIWLGKKGYSWRKEWRVNGWMFVAMVISSASDILFPHQIEQWRIAARVAVEMAPFVAILLWIRYLARWICGMDELHRRITQASVLFSVSATFFVVMLWHRLEQAGLFSALGVVDPDHSRASWDIGTVDLVLVLMTLFYFLGYRIFNRRYQ
jgi:hypothetical protein